MALSVSGFLLAGMAEAAEPAPPEHTGLAVGEKAPLFTAEGTERGEDHAPACAGTLAGNGGRLGADVVGSAGWAGIIPRTPC